jgi:hypothetical protein
LRNDPLFDAWKDGCGDQPRGSRSTGSNRVIHSLGQPGALSTHFLVDPKKSKINKKSRCGVTILAERGFGDRRTNPHRFALRIGWNLRGHNSSCELCFAHLRALTASSPINQK